MKLLRDDLVILPAGDASGAVYVKDPVSNETFEFDEVESYFLKELRNPYQEVVLLAKFNASSKSSSTRKFTLEDLHGFLKKLEEMGLIKGGTEKPIRNEDLPEEGPKASEYSEGREHLDGNGSSSTSDDSIRRYSHWSIFCPENSLDLLLTLYHPFRYFIYLLPVFIVFSTLSFLFNFDLISGDFSTANKHFGFLGHLIFTLFTINLMTQVVKGAIARYHHLKVPSFGVILAFGFIPRFDLFVEISQDTENKARLWIVSASILVRATLFAIGVAFWILTRSNGTLLSMVGIMLAIFSLITLFIAVNPLMRSDGYRFLTIYFSKPNLREKADLALKGLFSKQPSVVSQYIGNTFALRMYALSCIAFIVLLMGFLGSILAEWLESNYQGMGVATFLVIVFLMLSNIQRQKKFTENLKTSLRERHGQSSTSDWKRENMSNIKEGLGDVTDMLSKRAKNPNNEKLNRPYLKYFVIAVLCGCLFLPYQYEAGGSAEVFPIARNEIYAETSGVIDKVLFDGGEWVEEETVIAQLSNHKQIKDVRSTELSIKKIQEDIEVLLTTPSEEDINLAEQQLATANLVLKYSVDNYQRIENLYKSQTVSLDDYSEALEEMEVNRQKKIEKEAALLAIKNQINQHQIDSMKAERMRLEEELANNQELLRRTSLRAPISGQIITTNLQDLKYKYLESGDLFAEVEDTRRVRVEVSIPEADIGEIRKNSDVELKLWAYPDSSLHGKVYEIYPVTENATFGAVVKVVAMFPNENRLLRTGMTGHAKIISNEVFVITAFTRAIINFIKIEMWSWLP
ncbi:MAG: efflux RND transporter periplasmic adaptor subunit [Gammaproteobacteria bacterium]|nr:efflux RND transporter periplasmic adaptor subunit [Gammaproteobacteria bacterium]MCW8923321.1 efflux RND transporter periplasmic adaptor subunit [Gammaproteobacteria bacterium]